MLMQSDYRNTISFFFGLFFLIFQTHRVYVIKIIRLPREVPDSKYPLYVFFKETDYFFNFVQRKDIAVAELLLQNVISLASIKFLFCSDVCVMFKVIQDLTQSSLKSAFLVFR